MGYKLRKQRLNKKLILSLVSLIILVVITIAVSINSVFEKKFEEYIIKNNKNEVSNLINSIQSEYMDGRWNLYSIEKIGENAINKGIFIDLYDTDQTLIWGATTYSQDRCNKIMGNIENNMNHTRSNWHGKYTEQTFSLKNSSDEVIGSVKIGTYGTLYYMDNDVDFLEEINKVITIIGILMTLVTVFIAILISNNISKPIEVVSNMANLMGEGGFDSKIDYQSNIYEIDTLISSINNLSLKLEEQ